MTKYDHQRITIPLILSQQFFVPGPLPSMNEIISAAKGFNGRGFAYSKMKQEWTGLVVECIQKAKIRPMAAAVVTCRWMEKNRRRDLDNVRAGIKFILDGLVEAKILPSDTQKTIGRITDTIQIDKTNPGVWVELAVG